jgi:hypothetical protein
VPAPHANLIAAFARIEFTIANIELFTTQRTYMFRLQRVKERETNRSVKNLEITKIVRKILKIMQRRQAKATKGMIARCALH